MSSKPLKTLTSTTVRNRLNIVIFLIIIILLIVLVNFWISMKIMSGIRAYVNGEGLWSKHQKEAVINLAQYTTTNNPKYYTNFKKDVSIPLGDHQARMELDKA